MRSESWITLTGKRADSSAGVLLIDCIKQWSLAHLTEGNPRTEQSNRTFSCSWEHESAGTKFSHSVILETTAGVPSYDTSAILRMVGHFLLSTMPDDGLVETCESIAETFDYYTARQLELSRPRVSMRTFSPATAGESRVRPPFRISETE